MSPSPATARGWPKSRSLTSLICPTEASLDPPAEWLRVDGTWRTGEPVAENPVTARWLPETTNCASAGLGAPSATSAAKSSARSRSRLRDARGTSAVSGGGWLEVRKGPSGYGAVSRRDLETAMKGHVLGTATLIGTYEKEEG
jgi:hypothetical protein